jgi:chaperone modulatory protein CbpM
MNTPHVEWIWLDERESVGLTELSRVCGMSAQELDELVEYGALAPIVSDQPERLFNAACVMPLRTAGKMRTDYDLDLFTVVLLLDSLTRISTLERRVKALEATAAHPG